MSEKFPDPSQNLNNQESKYKKKYEEIQIKEKQTKRGRIIEKYKEEAQFNDKTIESIGQVLDQEIEQRYFELAQEWIKESKNKEKLKEMGYDSKKRKEKAYVIRMIELAGGSEEMEEKMKQDQEIDCLYFLKQEINKEDIQLDSQLLILNVLNKREKIIEEMPDGSEKKQEQENLFENKKQVVEKITGESLLSQKEQETIEENFLSKLKKLKEESEELEKVNKLRERRLEEYDKKLKKLHEDLFLRKEKKGIFANMFKNRDVGKIEAEINEIRNKKQDIPSEISEIPDRIKKIENEMKIKIREAEEEKIKEKRLNKKGAEKEISNLYQKAKNRVIDEYIEEQVKKREKSAIGDLKGLNIKQFIEGEGEVDYSKIVKELAGREIIRDDPDKNFTLLESFFSKINDDDKDKLKEINKGLIEKEKGEDMLDLLLLLLFYFLKSKNKT